MSDLNSVQIFGRVVRDATMKETSGGTKITEFSIATNITCKDEKEGFVQKGNFFPLAIYGSYAEKMLPHLKKGQRVIIEGYLKQNRWVTGEGKHRSATEIGVRNIHLIFDAKKTDLEKSEPAAESGAATEEQSFEPTQQQMQEMIESEPDNADFVYTDDFSDDGAIF
ncbi:MAG: single-stranded DNA-binding protein [Treponema sp.]|uniref:single-stranded DNA-binding protein n=1 Tax=Treponema sp. TaxID=166 RepID=UPI0025F1A53F|nr:single-stranded DNA-binding protein [Treponema sp.]MBQ8678320.1 single-stranded DNA-binding protein [Treponema sp.]